MTLLVLLVLEVPVADVGGWVMRLWTGSGRGLILHCPPPCRAWVKLPTVGQGGPSDGPQQTHCCLVPQSGTVPLTAALAQSCQWLGSDMAGKSLFLTKLDLGVLPLGSRLGRLPLAAGTGGLPSQPTHHRWTPGSSSPPHRRPGGTGQGGVSGERPVQKALSPDTEMPINSDKFWGRLGGLVS